MAFLDGREVPPEVVAEIEKQLEDPESPIRKHCRRIANATRVFQELGDLPLGPNNLDNDDGKFDGG